MEIKNLDWSVLLFMLVSVFSTVGNAQLHFKKNIIVEGMTLTPYGDLTTIDRADPILIRLAVTHVGPKTIIPFRTSQFPQIEFPIEFRLVAFLNNPDKLGIQVRIPDLPFEPLFIEFLGYHLILPPAAYTHAVADSFLAFFERMSYGTLSGSRIGIGNSYILEPESEVPNRDFISALIANGVLKVPMTEGRSILKICGPALVSN